MKFHKTILNGNWDQCIKVPSDSRLELTPSFPSLVVDISRPKESTKIFFISNSPSTVPGVDRQWRAGESLQLPHETLEAIRRPLLDTNCEWNRVQGALLSLNLQIRH
jgi:hypothetical protein